LIRNTQQDVTQENIHNGKENDCMAQRVVVRENMKIAELNTFTIVTSMKVAKFTFLFH